MKIPTYYMPPNTKLWVKVDLAHLKQVFPKKQ
jgi:hypothetical protein